MLGFALMGAGRIAQRHAELLGTGKIEGAKLVAICDVEPAKAKTLGDKYGVSSYSSYGEMASAKTFDVGVVLTPSGLHGSNTIEVAASGRHVVVEKPMALTLTDADDMVRQCDANGVKLFVIKQNRFNVPVRKLREALDEGRFGKIIMGTVRVRWCRPQAYYDQDSWRGTWALDGGVLTNQASHHVDLLEWMLGDVESVYAQTTTALVDIETEDTAVVCLKFSSGALGLIEATTATRPKDLEGSLSILGERGSVVVGGFAVNEMQTWQFEDQKESDAEVLEKFSVNPPDVYGFGHKSYYDHVVDCLVNGGPNLVGGLTGRRSLELISAIYESVETGQARQNAFQTNTVPARAVDRKAMTSTRYENVVRKEVGIVDVRFGDSVTLIEPVNLYGCDIGDDCFIGPFVEIQKSVKVGARTRVQSHAFICELVDIGSDCFVGHGVVFINDTFATGGPAHGDRSLWKRTLVGDRVSIGSNSSILPVSICDDVVIGAGAVVTRDIDVPGAYAGNPGV